jgi:hypothetical protein
MDALRLARQLPLLEMRRFQSLCEAVMWRITTRGFTLQEVLILAAMNIATGTVRDRETRVRNVAEQDKKEHTCNLETL